MRIKTAVATIAVAASLAGAGAAQASIWVNTPSHVARMLINRWTTSDGADIDYAVCHGVWSSPHQRKHGVTSFPRLRCSEWDHVDRFFRLVVTVTGRFRMRAVQISCNDRESRYWCP